MALEQKTQEYETLIRVNNNGRIGAHRQTITVITNGSQVLSSVLNDPEPLTREELQAYVAGITEDDWFVPPVVDQEATE